MSQSSRASHPSKEPGNISSQIANTSRMPEDGNSSRNFRSAYYERVGFCGIEGKKLCEALSTTPLDTEKLSDFCVRFDLGRHREEIWRLLLNVECHVENVDVNIRRIHDDHFNQLKRSLEIILEVIDWKPGYRQLANGYKLATGHIDRATDLNQSNQQQQLPKSINKHNHLLSTLNYSDDHVKKIVNNPTASINEHPGMRVVLMYLIEIGELQLSNIQSQLDSTIGRVMVSMAAVFVNTSSSLNSAYFLFRNFFHKIKEHQDTLKQLYEKSLAIISHDMPTLDQHIRSISTYDQLPCWYWFSYCFIDVLDERSLVRLWDRIVGGHLGFIQKIMKAILVKLEPHLMISQSPQDLVEILTGNKFQLEIHLDTQ